MAWRPIHRLWLALVVAAAGVGLAGGLVAGAGDGSNPRGAPPGAVSIAPTAIDVAVVPARTEAGTTADSSSRLVAGRNLLPLVAALVGLGGVAAVAAARGRSRPSVVGHRALLARRHSIALRAPPSLLPV